MQRRRDVDVLFRVQSRDDPHGPCRVVDVMPVEARFAGCVVQAGMKQTLRDPEARGCALRLRNDGLIFSDERFR